MPIYGCVGLGFVLSRFGFSWDAKVISPLILQVSLPLLVIHQFTRPEVTSGSIIRMLLAAVLVVGLFVVVFGVLLRVTGLPIRTYLAAACFSNMAIGFALGYLGFGNSEIRDSR